MVYKSIDHRKLHSICFYNNMEKVKPELALFGPFSAEKERALHLTSFLLSVLLIDNGFKPISEREFESLRFVKRNVVKVNCYNSEWFEELNKM